MEFGLFGPSIILTWHWWRGRCRIGLALAVSMAAFGYWTWYPPLLWVLDLAGLYPAHLEAFHNYHLRGDWLVYPVETS